MPPKKNLKLSAVRLSRPCEAQPSNRPPHSRIFALLRLSASGGQAGELPRRRRRKKRFGLIQEYCIKTFQIYHAANHHQSSVDRSAGAGLVAPVESMGAVALGAARAKLLVYSAPPCQHARHFRHPISFCLQQKRTKIKQ